MKNLKSILVFLCSLSLFPMLSIAQSTKPINDNNREKSTTRGIFTVTINPNTGTGGCTVKYVGGANDFGKIKFPSEKQLGKDYAVDIQFAGTLKSGAFARINQNSSIITESGVKLNDVKWEYKDSDSETYKAINDFPFSALIGTDSSPKSIRIYPESLSAGKNINRSAVDFEFQILISFTEI